MESHELEVAVRVVNNLFLLKTMMSDWIDTCSVKSGPWPWNPGAGRLTPLYTSLHNNIVIAKTESTLQTGRVCQLQCTAGKNVVEARFK